MHCSIKEKNGYITLAFKVGILWLGRWELGPSYNDAILFSPRSIYTVLVEGNFIIRYGTKHTKEKSKDVALMFNLLY